MQRILNHKVVIPEWHFYFYRWITTSTVSWLRHLDEHCSNKQARAKFITILNGVKNYTEDHYYPQITSVRLHPLGPALLSHHGYDSRVGVRITVIQSLSQQIADGSLWHVWSWAGSGFIWWEFSTIMALSYPLISQTKILICYPR